MTLPGSFNRFLCLLACAGLLGFAPAAHAWDWNLGWGGKTVKGSGVAKTETRPVSGYTRISLSIPAQVEIVQGSSEGLTIEGDDNIVPLVETVVENGGLKIRFAEKNLSTSSKLLKVVVNAKYIDGLSVAGAGDLHAANLKSPVLKASIAGSGDVKIDRLDAESLIVSIAGSGNFAAGGKAKAVETKVAGSGDLKIGRLEANDVKVSVAGSGDATVWARESLKVSVAGSGDVKYYGDAKVSQSVAGSGSVKRLGTAP
ncbi:MAG: head GIN domain-containing protein [Betaproteobacteria bacterium]